ncbi:MAG: PQQ-binding-like beta-propeller repeat protein, partial [Planctomycetes bacterium]|nr:PQQ-binding-like beta-propeller repeat protein [Planctomycetota bacterium]
LAAQKESKQRLGDILAGQGIVKQEEIDRLVRTQIEEEIFDIFRWKKAAFEFVDGPAPEELSDPRATNLNFDVNSLLMEAARRLDEWEIIKKAIPDRKVTYCITESGVALVAPGAPPPKEDEDPNQRVVLPSISTMRNVDEVIESSPCSEFETLKALGGLVSAGHVRLATVGDFKAIAAQATANGDSATALKAYRLAVGTAPQDHGVRTTLAQMLLAAGQNADAAEQYHIVGTQLSEAKEFDAAISAFGDALKAVPEHLGARADLLRCHVRKKDQAKTLELAVPVLEALVKAEDLKNARELGEALVVSFPKQWEFAVRLANICSDLHDHEASIVYFTKALDSIGAGARSDVAAIYEKILQIDPTRTDVKMKLEPIIAKRKQREKQKKMLMVGVAVGVVFALLGGGWYGYGVMANRKYDALWPQIVALKDEGKYAEAKTQLQDLDRVWGMGGIHDKIQTEIKRIDDFLADVANPEQYNKRAKETLDALQKKMDGWKKEQKFDDALKEIRQFGKDFEKSKYKDEAVKLAEEIEAERKAFEDALLSNKQAQETKAKIEELQGKAEAAEKTSDPRTALNAYDEILAVGANSPWKVMIENATKNRDRLKDYFDRAESLARQAQGSEQAGEYAKACEILIRLRREYPLSEVARDALLPLSISSIPPGAVLYVDNEKKGHTPCLLRCSPAKQSLELRLDLEGFESVAQTLSNVAVGRLEVSMVKNLKWAYRTNGPVECPPVSSGDSDVLALACRDGFLHLVDPASGRVKSRIATQLKSDIVSAPVIRGSVCYSGCNDAHLYAFDLAAGTVRWRTRVGKDFVKAPPTLSEDGKTVFIGGDDGVLYAVEAEAGTVLWSYKIGGLVQAGAVVARGMVIVTNDKGTVAAVDLKTQTEVWKSSTKGEVRGTPLLLGDTLYVGTRNNDTLFAIDLKDGKTRWTVGLPSSVPGPLAALDSDVCLTTDDGSCLRLDGSTGTPKWTWKGAGRTRVGPGCHGEVVYWAGEDGTLACIDAAKGETRWTWKAEGRLSSTPVVVGRLVLVGAEDACLYAIER